MSFTRTFVAVKVSSSVRDRAASLIERLRGCDAKVSWVAPANMHITLKFLGDQPDKRVATICRAVQQATSPVQPFEFHCEGVGAFPNPERPRTLWIGVSDGVEPFRALHASVDAALAGEGFAQDRRGFQPHLTIGRVRSGGASQQTLGTLIQKHAQFAAGTVSADEVLVFASQLSPDGPTYDVLARAKLGGG